MVYPLPGVIILNTKSLSPENERVACGPLSKDSTRMLSSDSEILNLQFVKLSRSCIYISSIDIAGDVKT